MSNTFADGVNNHTRRSSRRENNYVNDINGYSGRSSETSDEFDGLRYPPGSHSGRLNTFANDISNHIDNHYGRFNPFATGTNNHPGDSLRTVTDDANNQFITNYPFQQNPLLHPQSFPYPTMDQNPQTIDPRLCTMPISHTVNPPAIQRASLPSPLLIPSPMTSRRGPRSPQVSPTTHSPPASPRIKKYGCRLCQKMYDRSSRAIECEKKHWDNKPYPCNGVCGDPNW
jgi:hypothetical protein